MVIRQISILFNHSPGVAQPRYVGLDRHQVGAHANILQSVGFYASFERWNGKRQYLLRGNNAAVYQTEREMPFSCTGRIEYGIRSSANKRLSATVQRGYAIKLFSRRRNVRYPFLT